MSNYRQLLLLCVKALSTFDPELTGIDSHLESFLQSPESNLTDDADSTFVSEVLTGCVRYRNLVKVVVDGYYAKDGRTCLRADSNLYSVVSYLVMFRLEELGMGHFKRLVNTQHTGKIHKFLSFFFDEANLKEWIRDEWCKVYDHSFVQTTLMSPILRQLEQHLGTRLTQTSDDHNFWFEPEMKEFIEQLSDRLAYRTQPKKTTKPITEAKPFNLTKPRPRSVPTPDRIPTLKTYKPVPKSTYTRPVEADALTRAFEANRKKAEGVFLEAERLQFSCANAEKSQKTKTIMDQIRAEREAKLQYDALKPLPVPVSMLESRPLKLNTAAILREGARVQREEDEEEKRLASLEAGERDASEFIRWQEEMKLKSAAEKLAEVERKHLEGQLSYEEAIIARQSHMRENREKVMQIKEETEELMAEYFAQRKEQQREMRKLVEATMAGHQNTKEARTKLQQMKQKIVQQVAKESQELMERALEEAEAEMRRKTELIQQIRAMESVPIIRTKFVDLTETAGQGLLSEMSVAELRERLSLMRVAEAEVEEKRRKEITITKQAKEQFLAETLENISKHRTEQNKQALLKQEQQKETFKKHQADLKDRKVSDLQEKLEAKRKERERLQKEGTGITNRRSLNQGMQPFGKSRSSSHLQTATPIITTLLRSTNSTTT